MSRPAEEDSGDGGWDHHYRNFQIMQDRHAGWLDQAYATLLLDLKRRGLLEKRWSLAVGEFGLPPKINPATRRVANTRTLLQRWSPAVGCGGRDRRRRARGERPKEQPLTPADLAATVQRCVQHYQ